MLNFGMELFGMHHSIEFQKNIYQLHGKPFKINFTYSKNEIKFKNKSFVKSFPFVPYQK